MKKFLLPAAVVLLCILTVLIFITPGGGKNDNGKPPADNTPTQDAFQVMYA
jgi:hypothetical protein